jgi:hypothetical protein
VVLHEVNRRAAHNLMRNVMSWAFVTDVLTLTDWPPRLLSDGSALVAIGVSLMQTTAPGRYAIVLILPECGSTPVSRP